MSRDYTLSLRRRTEKLSFLDTAANPKVTGIDAPWPDGGIARLRVALLKADRGRAMALLGLEQPSGAVSRGRLEVLDPAMALAARDDEKAGLLHDAALGGDPVLVHALLSMGADPDQSSDSGRTALCEACLRRHDAVVLLLIQAGAALDVEPREGYPPILEASGFGGFGIVRELAQRGARPDRADRNGNTPLSRAALAGDRETVQVLLEAGAEVDPSDRGRRSPLQEAAATGRAELAAWLIDRAGADVDYQGGNTFSTPLIEAAANGNPDTVRTLLDRGADPMLLDDRGSSPLHHAAAYGHAPVVGMLLDRGADPGAHGILGFTPLMVASSTAMVWKRDGTALEALRILLQQAGDLEARDQNGWTALHHAAASAHALAVQALMEAGADIKARDERKRRPLDLAMEGRIPHPYEDRTWIKPAAAGEDAFFGTVRILLEAEKRVGLHPRRRASLLAKAREHRCPEVQALLLK